MFQGNKGNKGIVSNRFKDCYGIHWIPFLELNCIEYTNVFNVIKFIATK